jgi:hypothetical protein
MLLVYAGEKEVPARRLGDALAAAGYAASLVRIAAAEGSPGRELRERISEAGAVIVLWSKAVMAAEDAVAGVEAARHGGRLIEASADGIAPVASLDSNRVALLSGWRGEPHHPGWQKVRGDLERLRGVPDRSASRLRLAPGAAAASAATGSAEPLPPAGHGPFEASAAIVLGGVLLLFLGVAAAAWIGGSSSPVGDERAITAGIPSTAAPSQLAPTGEPALLPSESGGAALPAEATPLPSRSAQLKAPHRRGKASAAGRAAPRAGTARPSSNARYRNTTNMRLFCEVAGRSTPECRVFRREVRSAEPLRRAAPPEAGQAPSDITRRYRNARNMRRFCERSGRNTAECRLFRRQSEGR